MKRINRGTFFIVAVVAAIAVWLAAFGCNAGGLHIKGARDIRFGIDIRGGVEAIYTPKGLDRTPTKSELETVRSVLETRLDAKNILDREITVDTVNGEILLRFPWKSDEKDFDPKSAIAELGETALLTFRSPDGTVLIKGENVKSNSKALYNQQEHSNYVEIEFDDIGVTQFEAATEQLIGQQLYIYMDDTLISAPKVNEKISGGHAIITGMENSEQSKELSNKINSGALPFSVQTRNFSTISPTLGGSALKVMLYAGSLTFILICMFMLIHYKIPGLAACVGLALQASLQLLLLSVPQITLTIEGIAGIILSIGMGVDTNIIISERIKEELAVGKTLTSAIETGYHRAFSAVLDGNLTTAIIAVVLMVLGSGSMLSFGYTLITGVLLNFISGITASKLMVTSLSKYQHLKRPSFFGKRRAA